MMLTNFANNRQMSAFTRITHNTFTKTLFLASTERWMGIQCSM